MADEPETPATEGAESAEPSPQPEGSSQTPPQLSIRAQYIKDLSFENPRAPQSFASANERPKIEVSLGVKARPLKDVEHEVEIDITVKAQIGDQVTFLIELKYAGVFAIRNFAPEHIEPVTMIECPRLLFPFTRRVIADVTRDGGFPPLMLEPIDFAALYRRRKEAAEQQAPQQAPAAAVVPEPEPKSESESSA